MKCLRLKLDDKGHIDSDLWPAGSTIVCGSSATAGEKNGDDDNQALGRYQGRFATKIHMIVDSNGTPLNFEVTGPKDHDSPILESVLSGVSIENSNPEQPWTTQDTPQMLMY